MGPEETIVTIQGRGYAWSREGGLDPAAVLTLRRWIARLAAARMPFAAALRLEMSDLEQAGAVGALRAARTYDPARGRTFLSWATPKVRTEMGALLAGRADMGSGGGEEGGGEGEDEDQAAPCDDALLTGQILGRLPARDGALLERFYGLRGRGPLSLRELARREGLSPSAMSQRLARALYRARKAATSTPTSTSTSTGEANGKKV
jgi:DNA-directed RNA polymerase specialized sigma subunit